MILRDYQQRAVDSIYSYFESGAVGNPIVATPTASGKSVIQAEFIRGALAQFPETRVVCLTHVKELIEQNYEKMRALWRAAPAGIYSASIGRRDARAQVLFAGIQTVYNRAAELGWIDLIIIDECHLLPHKGEGQYRSFIAAVRKFNPHVKVIGLTATAYRQGQGMLTDGDNPLFTDIVIDLTQGEELVKLIDDGYLAPLHPKRTDLEIDISEVRTTGGEFNSGDLERAVNTDENTHAAIQEALQFSQDRTSCLWFCAGVSHAVAVRDALRNSGEQCEMVAGNTPTTDREIILSEFKSRRLKHVTNANVLTTGFDHPTLDMIVLLRPTRSASLHVQMLGRGMRIAEGKTDCLVLDFAGNTRRLGPINAIRIPKKPGAGGASESPTKDCPICKEILATAVRVCPHCGHEFPPPAPEIHAQAGTDKLIARAEDFVLDYVVDNVRYAVHEPPGKRPSLKVTYECGMQGFHEWVTLGYGGFAGSKAANWWMKRTPKFAPSTVDEAMTRTDELRKPLRIRVNTAGKYPEIVNAFYD